jgi:hypothetical protein
VRVVGISLVRNEDMFLERALWNAVDFCDRLMIADHGSRDGTGEIGRAFAARHGHVEYRTVARPSESHDMIRPYAGTRTWIFAVDGDEIYDPAGLARLKVDLAAGRFDGWRQVYGHALHCDEIDEPSQTAKGYMSPPSRTVTKLFNFNALTDWSGPCPERLHGGTISFREGFDEGKNCRLNSEVSWEESPFRCLHTVFLRRSSLDGGEGVPRLNISEKNSLGPVGRLSRALRGALGGDEGSAYKEEKHRRGERISVDASPFLGGKL